MNILELSEAVKNGNISPENFLLELWSLSKDHKRVARKYDAGKVSLYRTRTFINDIRPESISELSYPPAEKCRLQRANENGEQIFYASAGLPTTLAESRVKEGEYIITSKWKNINDLILQEVGFTDGDDGIEGLYNELFTHRDESMYKYSSKIAQHLMNADFISGLLYPSIINKNKSHNIAIKKDHVDKSLVFVNATLYKVKSISNDLKYSLDQLDFALPAAHGALDWKGRKKQWVLTKKGEELRMVSNGWDWDAYSPDGSYVEPQ